MSSCTYIVCNAVRRCLTTLKESIRRGRHRQTKAGVDPIRFHVSLADLCGAAWSISAREDRR